MGADPDPAAIGAVANLSRRLTEQIAHVEMQRSTLEEVIMRLAEQATHLNSVSSVLTDATYQQGSVLSELQKILSSSGAPAHLNEALKPAATSVTQAASALAGAAPAPPPTAEAALPPGGALPSPPQPASSFGDFDAAPLGFSASFDAAPPAPAPVPVPTPAPAPTPAPTPAPAPPPSLVETRARASTMPSSFGAYAPPKPPPRPAVIEPDMDDEEGVEYVANLIISGSPMSGSTLTASADFVGTPTIQWFRSKGGTKSEIDGACALAYSPTADDVGCTLRCECTGPYGGTPVGVDSAPVRVDAAATELLQKVISCCFLLLPLPSASFCFLLWFLF